MNVEFHIGGKLIEAVAVNWKNCHSYEDRRARIFSAEQWLKYRYRASIAILANWEIVIVAPSKMNKSVKLKKTSYERLD